MVSKDFDFVSGEIVMWSSRELSIDMMNKVLAKHDVAYGWEPISQMAALKLALQKRFGGRGVLIRGATNNRASVVAEQVDESGNKYTTSTTYAIVDWVVSAVQPDGSIGETSDELTGIANEHNGNCAARRVSSGMAAIIRTYFGGVRMGQQGGTYFVPKSSLDKWSKFAAMFADVCEMPIHRMQSHTDTTTAASVLETARVDLMDRVQDCLARIARVPVGDTPNKRARSKARVDSINAELADVIQSAKNLESGFGNVAELSKWLTDEIETERAMASLKRKK